MSVRFVAVCVVACFIWCTVLFRPIHDVDMFWQIRTGDLMLESGKLVTEDPFSSTHAGEKVPTVYWLSQLFYASTFRVTSWEFLRKLDAFLFVASLWLVAASLRGDQIRGPFSCAAALSMAFLVSLPHHGLRPQTFGMLGFAALVAHETFCPRGRFAALRVLLLVALWQNLHPSASGAVIYLGALWLGETARWLITRDSSDLKAITLKAVAAGVGCLMTPDGPALIEHSMKNTEIARHIQIEEWMPIWDPSTWPACWTTMWIFAVSIVLAAIVRTRARAGDLAVCFVFSIATLLVYRMSLFWAMAMIPIWSRWIDIVYPMDSEGSSPNLSIPKGGLILIASLGAVVAVMNFAPMKTFDKSIPLAGVRKVHELGIHGTIYNYREWSGPLLLECGSDVKVIIDGRVYVYPIPEWDKYANCALGKVPVDQIEAEYHPDAFFLRPNFHEALIPLIRESGRWREAYADEECVLFVPSGR